MSVDLHLLEHAEHGRRALTHESSTLVVYLQRIVVVVVLIRFLGVKGLVDYVLVTAAAHLLCGEEVV